MRNKNKNCSSPTDWHKVNSPNPQIGPNKGASPLFRSLKFRSRAFQRYMTCLYRPHSMLSSTIEMLSVSTVQIRNLRNAWSCVSGTLCCLASDCKAFDKQVHRTCHANTINLAGSIKQIEIVLWKWWCLKIPLYFVRDVFQCLCFYLFFLIYLASGMFISFLYFFRSSLIWVPLRHASPPSEKIRNTSAVFLFCVAHRRTWVAPLPGPAAACPKHYTWLY